MTDRTDTQALTSADDPEVARLIWQMAGIGFALMVAAAVLLWWHFGPVIFFDTLATLQGCF
jgi:hypothetical protein